MATSNVTIDVSHMNTAVSVPESIVSWSSVKILVDRVHKHVCVHATFSDMHTLLLRNRLWTNEVQHYLSHVGSKYSTCKASATPPPNRRVSLAILNRQLNDVVCVDHFHLDDHILFHTMDTVMQFSAAHIVESTGLSKAVISFESCWFAQFWPPTAVHANAAFYKGEVLDMLKECDIFLRPMLPNRHQKNMLEPRHGPIRSIYLRLRHASPNASTRVLALRDVRISKYLYGSDVISSFEAAKGFTSPVKPDVLPIPVDAELL